MTQGELDHLRKSCIFPARIQTRLLEVGETIMSAHPGEVNFYEAAFLVGLRFSTLSHSLEDLGVLHYLSHPVSS